MNAVAPSAQSALTSTLTEMRWLNGRSAATKFEGEFSNLTRSYADKRSGGILRKPLNSVVDDQLTLALQRIFGFASGFSRQVSF